MWQEVCANQINTEDLCPIIYRDPLRDIMRKYCKQIHRSTTVWAVSNKQALSDESALSRKKNLCTEIRLCCILLEVPICEIHTWLIVWTDTNLVLSAYDRSAYLPSLAHSKTSFGTRLQHGKLLACFIPVDHPREMYSASCDVTSWHSFHTLRLA